MKPLGFATHNWLVRYAFQRQLRDVGDFVSGVVLDLGCGERHYEDFIRSHALQYYGVDWTKTLHHHRMDVVADLNQALPFLESSADTIFSVSVMEHLHNPVIFLQEVHRVLRPGGRLVLQVPFQWRVHEAPHDYFRYTLYGLRHLLSVAGFHEASISATTGFWTTWCLKLNYHSLRWMRGPALQRRLLRVLLVPFWFANQVVALALDRQKPNSEETQGYLVVAAK
jgi:SAM-dependent methyltransferase